MQLYGLAYSRILRIEHSHADQAVIKAVMLRTLLRRDVRTAYYDVF